MKIAVAGNKGSFSHQAAVIYIAANDLASGKLATNSAVLAPKLCAQLYGLGVVAENVQDDDRNQTHFLVCASAS